MEKKKTKKKWREIRSAVTMMCVMAAMLSTATFAWFTLTSSPTVTGMQMTAASQGGLLVCETSDGTFQNAVALTDTQAENKTLVPVSPSTEDGYVGFRAPVYTGGTVSSLGDVVEENYVAKYVYYLKAEGDTPVNVGVIMGNINQTAELTVTNGMPNASGTVVRQNDESTAEAAGVGAVRIGLVIGEDDFEEMIVIEPNNDLTIANTTKATNGITYDTTFTPNVSAASTGLIDGVTTESEGLFEVAAGEVATKVTMYVWLEGTDDQCCDEIMADLMEAQIQFNIVD